MRVRLQKLVQDNGEALRYLLRVNMQAGQVALAKGVWSNFALGLYHWLSPAPMGIMVQLRAETVTALFAMVQRAQGPQRQHVSVYHVADVDREKEEQRMWSDPVKLKSCEEHLDTRYKLLASARKEKRDWYRVFRCSRREPRVSKNYCFSRKRPCVEWRVRGGINHCVCVCALCVGMNSDAI